MAVWAVNNRPETGSCKARSHSKLEGNRAERAPGGPWPYHAIMRATAAAPWGLPLADRFWREAEAALPIHGGRDLDEVFAGLEWRRLRLRQDQQVQEWAGVTR